MIKKLLKKFYIDKAFLKFVIVGVINTLVGSAIMFGCYNLLNWGYEISTFANVFLTSILSYFLNKHFTFKNGRRGVLPIVEFAVNIAVCYFVGYGVAKPLVSWMLSGLGSVVRDNVSMLVGMVLFTLLNYFGQRFIVFSKQS
ncbi:MAG: GtrA family protein [Oscillospiraceae bacterium]|nr:GtrA family protein [Oscillospiraceae bacterium]